MPKKKIASINYTARDFETIKDSLVEYAKRYYPDTYKDFNEASFGSLMLDTVSYIGDILSFYVDYQANESFLDTALEYNNVVKLARQVGYKYPGTPSSQGELSFYVLVPANSAGTSPDEDYYPILQKGSSFSSTGGAKYLLTEDVDFSKPSNEIVVAKVNSTTGVPTYYAVKASGKIISGEIKSEFIDVGSYTKFKQVELNDGEDITEILEVTDSDGQEYFEVAYLSQDVIYKEFANPVENDKKFAPKIIKPVTVPRRFVFEREPGRAYLQFGYGSESDLSSDQIVDPSNVLMELTGKKYITETSFDPYNFISSDKFGVVPTETTLEISYRTNSSDFTNSPVGTVTAVADATFKFKNSFNLDSDKLSDVKSSLEVINEEPIVGDLDFIDVENIKSRAAGIFSSQNRAVTAQDYKTLAYSMDSKFGAIKRCNIVLDQDSFKRNLNMYVISEDFEGKLVTTNKSIKDNLKTWLNRYKMIVDTIDILDAKIINLAVDFTVVSEIGVNKGVVLQRCFNALKEFLKLQPDIGEPVYITKIFNTLNSVQGVVDTVKVDIHQKVGDNYSDVFYNVKENMSSDNKLLLIPKNVIYEFKYLDDDLKGVVK
jgi:hypothetical protein